MNDKEESMNGKTIAGIFSDTVRTYPDNTVFHYFRDAWTTISYREFNRHVLSTAAYLISTGIKKGDRVAVISENRPEWGCAYLSILKSGGIAVPIDAQLGPDEIANLLVHSESRFVFHSAVTSGNIGKAAEKLRRQKHGDILLMDFDDPAYHNVLEANHPDLYPETEAGEVASVIYTSGTTGRPKGVMLTHSNFCSDANALIGAKIVSHDDNVISILPLHHTYAFMCTFLVPVFLGASITYPASLKGPDLLSAIREREGSVLIGVPQLLGLIRNGIINKIRGLPGPVSFILLKLLRLSGWVREKIDVNLGRIIFKSAHAALGERFRFFASGGARLDPGIMKDLEALGFTVLEGYGLTETSPVVTFNPFEKRKHGSVGKPIPSVELSIVNPSETGEGEIAIRGPMVMEGYYKNPDATEEVLRDGWFMTGDRGWIDQDGYLFITGRSKEVIVLSSGKNVYPEDVENVYLASPLIKEMCVSGVEEKGIAESLHALIVPDLEYARKSGITNIQEALKWDINDLSARLSSSMRIRGYLITTEPLPRTALGKLRRFMIRDLRGKSDVYREKRPVEDETFFRDGIAMKVRETLEQFVKPDRPVRTDDNLELDLGLDSLSKIELVAASEKIFSLSLAEDFMNDVQTVRQLVEKIRHYSREGISDARIIKSEWNEILLREPSPQDLELVLLESAGRTGVLSFIIYSLLKGIFRIFFRLEAKGLENIPTDKSFIIAPNHTSYLDGFVLLLSLPFSYVKNIYTLGLSDFFDGYLKGRFARMAHIIPIDSASYLSKALQMSSYVLRNHRSLAVFPEGGRSFDGSLMVFKKGVGILAVELGTVVVPASIDGAFEALPRGSSWPQFTRITVTFGKPLSASDVSVPKGETGIDAYQHFADELRDRVKLLQKKA